MNQSKLDAVRAKMSWLNIGILGISEVKGPEWVNSHQRTPDFLWTRQRRSTAVEVSACAQVPK